MTKLCARPSGGGAMAEVATGEEFTLLETSELERPLDFEQLVRRCLGRIDLAERLLASFDSRFPEELAQIDQCLLEADATRLARLVHQAKGAAANISAPALFAIMAKMEHAARINRLEDVGTYLALAYGAWGRFQDYKQAARTNVPMQ